MQKDSKMQIYYMASLQMYLILAQLKINWNAPLAIYMINTTLKKQFNSAITSYQFQYLWGFFFPNKNTYF